MLSQARIASKYIILVQFEVGSRERTAILPKKGHMYDTLRSEFIEKAVCMKTKDQLCQSESLIPRLPRVVLKANSQCDLQDLPVQEARYKTMRKSAGMPIPLSTVKQQDVRRQNKVKKLIEMFEKHQHKEQFLKDLSLTKKINRFSEESQQLLADINHTEIFELCENSGKHQCPDCNTFWEIGIICCT